MLASDPTDTLSHSRRSLTKLVYTVFGAALGLYTAAGVCDWALNVPVNNDNRLQVRLAGVNYTYSFLLVTFVLVMVAVCFLYRPLQSIFFFDTDAKRNQQAHLGAVAWGLISGLTAFILTIPISTHGDPHTSALAHLMLQTYELAPLGIAGFLLIVLAVPISSEAVFRGIIFKSLVQYMSVPAAVIISSALFAYMWPVLNVQTALVIAITTSLLYYYTRSLLAPIIADAVVCLCTSALVLSRSIR